MNKKLRKVLLLVLLNILGCDETPDDMLIKGSKNGDVHMVFTAMLKGASRYNEAMTEAALNGHIAIVDRLLNNVGDLDTPMCMAAKGGHIEIVKIMMNNGATRFDSALLAACLEGHLDIAELMINQGARSYGLALKEASIGGHREVVEYMLEVGKEDYEEENYKSAIKAAKERGHMHIVYLLEVRYSNKRQNL